MSLGGLAPPAFDVSALGLRARYPADTGRARACSDLMALRRAFSLVALTVAGVTGCGKGGDDTSLEAQTDKTVLDLGDVKTNPSSYAWFDFRPNVQKLILAGDAETEHVAILWYTVSDGAVGLHYHAKTESVYVVDGTQTDAKGVYPTGTLYFNPPGSGHEITNSSGFFILAYASPPDFGSTDRIGEYTPVRIDTRASELASAHAFEPAASGARVFTMPLDAEGGMTGQLLEVAAPSEHEYVGNYLLVLEGSCRIDGALHGREVLVVGTNVAPRRFTLSAADGPCLALGVSF